MYAINNSVPNKRVFVVVVVYSLNGGSSTKTKEYSVGNDLENLTWARGDGEFHPVLVLKFEFVVRANVRDLFNN